MFKFFIFFFTSICVHTWDSWVYLSFCARVCVCVSCGLNVISHSRIHTVAPFLSRSFLFRISTVYITPFPSFALSISVYSSNILITCTFIQYTLYTFSACDNCRPVFFVSFTVCLCQITRKCFATFVFNWIYIYVWFSLIFFSASFSSQLVVQYFKLKANIVRFDYEFWLDIRARAHYGATKL